MSTPGLVLTAVSIALCGCRPDPKPMAANEVASSAGDEPAAQESEPAQPFDGSDLIETPEQRYAREYGTCPYRDPKRTITYPVADTKMETPDDAETGDAMTSKSTPSDAGPVERGGCSVGLGKTRAADTMSTGVLMMLACLLFVRIRPRRAP